MAIFKGNFSISDITKYHHYLMKAGHVFSGHSHPTYELNFIQRGKVQIKCGDSLFEIDEGQAIIIPPYKFHSCNYVEQTEVIVVNMESFYFNSYEKALIYTLDKRSMDIFKLFCSDIEENALLDHSELNICIEAPRSAKKLLEVFLQFSDSLKKEYSPHYNESSTIFNHAAQYMFENLAEKLTVADIARECKVCCTTLKNIFNNYTDGGCMTFFNRLKLEQAKSMLINGANCKEVTEALGFSSQAYFSKRFKELYGTTPSRINK